MGGPRRFKNKYEAPKKLWEMDRIKEDKALKSEYGLKNARELWTAEAELKKYRREARRLLSLVEEERVKDVVKILTKLNKFGILPKTATVDDILSLNIKTILERRLQTRVIRQGLAKTPRQARQLVAHGFIAIGDRAVTIPSYMVTEKEDALIRLCKPIDLETHVPGAEKAETKEKKEHKKEESKVEEKTEAKKSEAKAA